MTRGLSSILPLLPLPCPSMVKATGSWDLVIHILPFFPSSLKPAESASSQQPLILKLPHCTIHKAATLLPFPRGDAKRRGLHISQRTWSYSHTFKHWWNVWTLQFPPPSKGSSSILNQFPRLASILPGSVPRAWPEPALTSRQGWFRLCQNSFHQDSGLLSQVLFTVLKSAEKRYLRNCKMSTSIGVFQRMSRTVLLFNLFSTVYWDFFKA